jgi:Uma2 family endonuclease
MSIDTSWVTIEQLLAMPDDGIDRELIRGELRKTPTTKRNRFHTYLVIRLARFLDQWLDSQPEPCGEVHTGEVGTIPQRNPDSTVGIDVAYFSAETIARQTDQTTLVEGTPRLAVEVLSPPDKVEEIYEKVREYRSNGVEPVWIVDPYFETIQVHRRGRAPVTYNHEHRVNGGDVLPGLDFAVVDIFHRPADVANQ